MRHEYWSSEDGCNNVGMVGIKPMNENVLVNPPTLEVGGRYGPVGRYWESPRAEESLAAPVDNTGASQTEESPIAPSNNEGARYGLVGMVSTERIIRTPRRRLVSECVFEKMMGNTNQPRYRSRSCSVRPRVSKAKTVPSNQMLISTFTTPKRGCGEEVE